MIHRVYLFIGPQERRHGWKISSGYIGYDGRHA